MTDDATAMVDRLARATNDHDLEALVSCFTDDYVNETPAHPARGFVGREQVRDNWRQIFAFVPDIRAEVVGRAVDGDTVWSEWRMSGTRGDGSPHRMAGVIIFEVERGQARRARFFLEPVDESGSTVSEAVRTQVVR